MQKLLVVGVLGQVMSQLAAEPQGVLNLVLAHWRVMMGSWVDSFRARGPKHSWWLGLVPDWL